MLPGIAIERVWFSGPRLKTRHQRYFLSSPACLTHHQKGDGGNGRAAQRRPDHNARRSVVASSTPTINRDATGKIWKQNQNTHKYAFATNSTHNTYECGSVSQRVFSSLRDIRSTWPDEGEANRTETGSVRPYQRTQLGLDFETYGGLSGRAKDGVGAGKKGGDTRVPSAIVTKTFFFSVLCPQTEAWHGMYTTTRH